MHLLARTLRYLAHRYQADPGRADRDSSNQNTARTNAADASATLRNRRRDHDDVEAYLQARRLRHPEGSAGTGRDGHGTEHAL